MLSRVRAPAVAGLFYPGSPSELTSALDALLEDAHARAASGPPRAAAKVIVAPHAGYIYSGPIAATAYEALRADASRVRRVILLGPTHRVYVRGLALPGVDALETPLGALRVDAEAVASLAGMPQVVTSAAAHAQEHSLEVHLPFLQRLFGEQLAIVPLAVGEATPEEVADVLERLWGGDETRIVVSTDLSHHLPHARARRVDAETARRIVALASVEPAQACGARPLNGVLEVLRRRGLALELVDLRSSGDTAGGHDAVVGYGAFVAREEGAPSSSGSSSGSSRGASA
jgi:MEMO1 family protein